MELCYTERKKKGPDVRALCPVVARKQPAAKLPVKCAHTKEPRCSPVQCTYFANKFLAVLLTTLALIAFIKLITQRRARNYFPRLC